jgi:hypothetical protein
MISSFLATGQSRAKRAKLPSHGHTRGGGQRRPLAVLVQDQLLLKLHELMKLSLRGFVGHPSDLVLVGL